jgi:hypothetical protein
MIRGNEALIVAQAAAMRHRRNEPVRGAPGAPAVGLLLGLFVAALVANCATLGSGGLRSASTRCG